MYINSLEQLIAGAEVSIKHSINVLSIPSVKTGTVYEEEVVTSNDITVKNLTDAIKHLHTCKFDNALMCIRVCPDYPGKNGDIDAVKRCKYYSIKNVIFTAAVSFAVTVISTKALTTAASSLMYKKDANVANANVLKFGMAYVKTAKQKPHSFSEATRLLKKELKK